ncbi:hypothetical protein [Nocardia brasiliensis]|uniref:hypothetical protein n=1 Tax=Nocardia brasiliensis TaxID=37326 RepID=UPI002457488D|nr:hypothetical protein [Nocardia brasiliensis]
MSERALESGLERAGVGLSGIFAAEGRVLRFYPDGTVLDINVDPREVVGSHIEKWLRKEAPFAETRASRYLLGIDRRLSFRTSGDPRDGEVEVVGFWYDEELTLDIRSVGGNHDMVRFRKIA